MAQTPQVYPKLMHPPSPSFQQSSHSLQFCGLCQTVCSFANSRILRTADRSLTLTKREEDASHFQRRQRESREDGIGLFHTRRSEVEYLLPRSCLVQTMRRGVRPKSLPIESCVTQEEYDSHDIPRQGQFERPLSSSWPGLPHDDQGSRTLGWSPDVGTPDEE